MALVIMGVYLSFIYRLLEEENNSVQIDKYFFYVINEF